MGGKIINANEINILPIHAVKLKFRSFLQTSAIFRFPIILITITV